MRRLADIGLALAATTGLVALAMGVAVVALLMLVVVALLIVMFDAEHGFGYCHSMETRLVTIHCSDHACGYPNRVRLQLALVVVSFACVWCGLRQRHTLQSLRHLGVL